MWISLYCVCIILHFYVIIYALYFLGNSSYNQIIFSINYMRIIFHLSAQENNVSKTSKTFQDIFKQLESSIILVLYDICITLCLYIFWFNLDVLDTLFCWVVINLSVYISTYQWLISRFVPRASHIASYALKSREQKTCFKNKCCL